MDTSEFRLHGKEMIDYIANYLETISERRVTPEVEPGYLRKLLPITSPEKGEKWEDIMKDFEKYILSGVTHWQHPMFYAYFPAGNSYPSILADLLGNSLGCVGFSWASSPAFTELETIVLDWLSNMIGLPQEFSFLSEKGGGVIQSSASDCVLICLLAARRNIIKTLNQQHPFVDDEVHLSKLIAYCSTEAHSGVEKACIIGFVKLHILETDENFQLRGATLAKAMQDDRAVGLIPFFVSTTLGTTSCCSFDRLDEIGPLCKEEGVWLHVDAAYAGSAFICPEFRHFLKGIEYAMSFGVNPNKWMLVNFDCSAMWVKDRHKIIETLAVNPIYLRHKYSDSEKCIDYMHWSVQLSRRFRSLKLWFVIRTYGVEGIQKYIRENIRLAKKFESLVRENERFEIVNDVQLGLVCFRLKGTDILNQELLTVINDSGKLHMIPASLKNRFVIRFCICSPKATDDVVEQAWKIIVQFAEDLLETDINKGRRNKYQKEENPKEESFFDRKVSDEDLNRTSDYKQTTPTTDNDTTGVSSIQKSYSD